MQKYFTYIKESWNNFYLIPILLGVVASNYLPLLVGLLLFVILSFRFGEKVFVIFTIVVFLTLTTSIDATLRLIVQVINFVILFTLFFKNYGAEFKNYPKIPKLIIYLIGSFFAIMIISILFSSYKELGIQQIVRTILFFIYIYLYYSLLNLYKDTLMYLGSFAIIGLLFTGMLIYQFIFSGFSFLSLNDEYLLRLKDFYVHKNTMGSFFTIVIIFSVLLFHYMKTNYKYIILALQTIFFLGLLITNARASFIALFSAVVFIYLIINRKIVIYLFGSVALVFSTLIIEPVYNLVSLYFRLESVAAGRDLVYNAVFSSLPHIWLTGAGPGAAKYYMFEYYPYLMGSSEQLYWDYYVAKTEYGHAHNFYLYYFTDLGILGLIFSITFLFIYLKIGLKCINFYKNYSLKDYFISISLTAVGLSYFVRGIFEWGGILSYGFIAIDLPFWIIFSVLVYLYKQTLSKPELL